MVGQNRESDRKKLFDRRENKQQGTELGGKRGEQGDGWSGRSEGDAGVTARGAPDAVVRGVDPAAEPGLGAERAREGAAGARAGVPGLLG